MATDRGFVTVDRIQINSVIGPFVIEYTTLLMKMPEQIVPFH